MAGHAKLRVNLTPRSPIPILTLEPPICLVDPFLGFFACSRYDRHPGQARGYQGAFGDV